MVEPLADAVDDGIFDRVLVEHCGADEGSDLRLLPHDGLGFAAHPRPQGVGNGLRGGIDPLQLGHAVLRLASGRPARPASGNLAAVTGKLSRRAVH